MTFIISVVLLVGDAYLLFYLFHLKYVADMSVWWSIPTVCLLIFLFFILLSIAVAYFEDFINWLP